MNLKCLCLVQEAKLKKSHLNGFPLYNILEKKQNNSDIKQISACHGLGGGEGRHVGEGADHREHKGNLGVMEIF